MNFMNIRLTTKIYIKYVRHINKFNQKELNIDI